MGGMKQRFVIPSRSRSVVCNNLELEACMVASVSYYMVYLALAFLEVWHEQEQLLMALRDITRTIYVNAARNSCEAIRSSFIR